MGEIATTESLGQKELESLVQQALEEATRQGMDQAEVAASHDTGLTATARLGDVESLEYTNDRGIGITVYKDMRLQTPRNAWVRLRFSYATTVSGQLTNRSSGNRIRTSGVKRCESILTGHSISRGLYYGE